MGRGLFVPVDASMPRHRKTLRLAALLKVGRREAVGIMIDLWSWALGSADHDGFLPGVDAPELAAALDWRGNAESLITGLVGSGYLEREERGLTIHDWEDGGGKVVSEREAERQRKARGRMLSQSAEIPRTVRGNSTLDETRQEERRLEERESAPGDPAAPVPPTPPSSGSRSRFTPPTVEQVAEHCRDKGYTFDPQAFVAYYASNGWRVGRSPMKSWQAACVTWQSRETRRPGNGRGHRGPDEPPEIPTPWRPADLEAHGGTEEWERYLDAHLGRGLATWPSYDDWRSTCT